MERFADLLRVCVTRDPNSVTVFDANCQDHFLFPSCYALIVQQYQNISKLKFGNNAHKTIQAILKAVQGFLKSPSTYLHETLKAPPASRYEVIKAIFKNTRPAHKLTCLLQPHKCPYNAMKLLAGITLP